MSNLQQIIDLSRSIDFKKVVSRPINPLTCDILQTPLADSSIYSKTIGEKFSYMNLIVISGDFYDDMILVNKELEIIAQKSKLSTSYLKDKAEAAQLYGERLLTWSKNLKNTTYNPTDFEQVRKIFEDYIKISNDFMPYMIFALSAGTYLENKIKKQLQASLQHSENVDEAVITLTLPDRPNLQSLEQHEFYSLFLNKNIPLKEELDHHLEKYAHIGYRWGAGTSWSEFDLYERISQIPDVKQALEELEINERNAHKKSIELLDEINADQSLRVDVELAKKYVWLRTYRSDVISFSLAYLGEILDVYYMNKGYRHDDFKYFTIQELLQGAQIGVDEINARKHSFSVVFIDGDKYYLSGDESVAYKTFLDSKVHIKTTIAGTVANRPLEQVVGKVRVIVEPSQLINMAVGEILVTPMTTPNFIQAMHKAAGFITDEGGILCHAAILSRELNKPCIVGTENASLLLKTGDIVRMDLVTGEVTKL